MILRWSIAVLSFLVQTITSTSIPDHRPPATLSPEIMFQQIGLLPNQTQVSDYLKIGETKRFVYKSPGPGVPLSITVTPCSSVVVWSVYLAPANRSFTSGVNGAKLLKEFTSSDLDTYKTNSSDDGQYVVEMRTLDRDTHVQIFASEELEPPHAVTMTREPIFRLQPNLKKHGITIHWDLSLIDPHVTDYCLVMSSRKNYSSLCGAHDDKYGPYGPGLGTVKGNTSKMSNSGDQKKGNVLISCVKRRTHHTVTYLEHGKTYYLSLFAINRRNHFTFPYGSALIEYDEKVKQAKLKDGKSESVNLRKLDGRVVFKFKAGRRTGKNMTVSVMPCGGAVDVFVIKQGKPRNIVDKRIRLYSYGRLLVSSVRRGERFRIEVKSSDREELKRTTGVEVLATTQEKFPLPELPTDTAVRELPSMRECQSVTIAWLPSPDATAYKYCIYTRESHGKEMELHVPNQCSLDKRIKNKNNFISTTCLSKNKKSAKANERDAMIQTIGGLKANRKYVVQVIIEKETGKSLSYNLLTVQTKPKCE